MTTTTAAASTSGPLTRSELDDLEIVALQVIADPKGYLERVVVQLLDRLATPAMSHLPEPLHRQNQNQNHEGERS